MVKNVVVITVDQLRADALNPEAPLGLRAPRMNDLARRGLSFTNAFCPSPVCAPARHSLATGLYPLEHGVLTNKHEPAQPLVTLGHIVGASGIEPVQIGPMSWRGEWDTGFGPQLARQEVWKASLPDSSRRVYEAEAADHVRRTTGGPSPRRHDEYWGSAVSQAARESLERFAASGERFLLWCSIPEPHPPFRPPAELYQANLLGDFTPWVGDETQSHAYVRQLRDEWRHLSRLEWRQIVSAYRGMVELADTYVGTVLDSLEAMGLADDTAVILTADHGEMAGEHGMMLKFSFREGAIRVPLVVVAPGLHPGVRTDLVESLDVFATVLDLFGLESRDDTASRALVREPACFGGSREFVYASYDTDLMIRTREWKLNVYDGTPGELFQVGADPSESVNLLEDASTKPITELLTRELDAWRKRIG